MGLPHLDDKANEVLGWDIEERKAYILQERWVGYPEAHKVIRRLEDLLKHPKVHRMPNLLVVGETNNGKTTAINHFYERYLPHDDLQADSVALPVLMVQAPPEPNERRFYAKILDLLFAPYRATDRIEKMEHQVFNLLSYLGVKMLIIDEIQHILAGSQERQRRFLNVIKYLGNELRIPIVGAGIPDAVRAIQTDPQLANRFETIVLPIWQHDKGFRMLVNSLERMLPLKHHSKLAKKDTLLLLHTMSEGIIGELSTLLNRAAISAIDSNEERITEDILKNLDWTLPSQRRRDAEKQLYA